MFIIYDRRRLSDNKIRNSFISLTNKFLYFNRSAVEKYFPEKLYYVILSYDSDTKQLRVDFKESESSVTLCIGNRKNGSCVFQVMGFLKFFGINFSDNFSYTCDVVRFENNATKDPYIILCIDKGNAKKKISKKL